MPFQDLDAAWKADRFESLRERLRRIREDARDGGTGLPDFDAELRQPPQTAFELVAAGWRNMAGSSTASRRDQPKMPASSGNMPSNTISSRPGRKDAGQAEVLRE